MAIVSEVDAVLVGGGQLLTDRDFGFPPKILEVALIAEKLGKPLAVFGCGTDEQLGTLAKTFYTQVFNRSRYISVRDSLSAKWISSHFDRVPQVHPDPAIVANALPRISSQENRTRLGVGVQDFNHFRVFTANLRVMSSETYTKFWCNVVESARREGEEVSVFSNGDPLDQEEVHKIRESLALCGVEVKAEDRPETPLELVSYLNSVRSLVCSRLHAGIIAFSCGAKVVPLSWDSKVANVWREIGVGEPPLPPEVMLKPQGWTLIKKRLASQIDRPKILRDARMRLEAELQTCLRTLEIL